MLRDVGVRIERAILEGAGRISSRTQERRSLPADLLESDEAYLAVFDAPGVEPGDVRVSFEEGTIEVRIGRFRGIYEDFEMLFPGRSISLHGRVDLPEDATVDPDAATAVVTDRGTLEVTVPKETDEVAVDIETTDEETTDDETTDDATTGHGPNDDETAGETSDAPDS